MSLFSHSEAMSSEEVREIAERPLAEKRPVNFHMGGLKRARTFARVLLLRPSRA